MHTVVTERLGKQYQLGEGGRYTSVGEALARAMRRRPRPSRDAIWALRNIDLEIHEGEALGVMGRNGAGKSTLLRVLAGITRPTVGLACTRGRVGVLLEVGTGFHHELTGRENIELNGVILGMSRRDIRRRFDAIVEFAGVERFLDTPLKRYSSGMYLRLAFSVAAHVEPDIMLVDEVLAIGDFEFQRKCLGRVSDLQEEGRTVVFVSHDLGAISEICSRAVWLEGGRIVVDGPVHDVVTRYLRSGPAGVAVSTFAPEAGPASLASVALVDDDGKPVAAPRRDEPLAIEVRFDVREPIRGLDCELWLVNGRGVSVVNESWEDHRDEVGRPGEPGMYRTVLRIPPVLAPDEYTAWIWLGTEYDEYVRREALRFALRPLPGDVTVWSPQRPGRVVRPDVRWQVAYEPRVP